MKNQKIALSTSDVPEKLRNIPQPPKQLFVVGNDINELLERPCVTIVGSRKMSAYGESVTYNLAKELASAGVVIISGLALGIDGVAHRAAIDAGGLTIAVLPTGVDVVYPRSNQWIAKQILEHGGALASEYDGEMPSMKHLYIRRNRIASGMGDALLITEASERSGTLHTADFALEQDKPVLAVPGNITSPNSAGTNNLIKSGATPVTSADDVFHALGLQPARSSKKAPKSGNPHEQALLDLLFSGIADGDELLAKSELEISLFNQTLTMLEIRGQVRALGGNRWSLT